MMCWDVEIVGFTVTSFTVKRVSIIPTILITAALPGRIAIVLLPSIVQICLPLVLLCNSNSCANGCRFPSVLYVTNLLADV